MQTSITKQFPNQNKKLIAPSTLNLHQVNIQSKINRDISFDLLNYMERLQNKSYNNTK